MIPFKQIIRVDMQMEIKYKSAKQNNYWMTINEGITPEIIIENTLLDVRWGEMCGTRGRENEKTTLESKNKMWMQILKNTSHYLLHFNMINWDILTSKTHLALLGTVWKVFWTIFWLFASPTSPRLCRAGRGRQSPHS